jgi:hypothetical protein
MENKNDPKETPEQTESTNSVVDQQPEPTRHLHDKRYEEPFENEGAYADDDIDE